MAMLDDSETDDLKRLLVVLDGAMANFPGTTDISVQTVEGKLVTATARIAPYRLAAIIRRELGASDAR